MTHIAEGGRLDNLSHQWQCYFSRTPVTAVKGRCPGTLYEEVRRLRSPRGSRLPQTAAVSLPYDDWLIERLKDPRAAAAYLEAAMEDGDQTVLMLALRQEVTFGGE